MQSTLIKAPELIIEKWINTTQTISLEKLKGKVVVMFAFQMLCPGCVEHCIPQAKKVHAMFEKYDVEVIGLHTVFEHHEAMAEVSLTAFIHEYRIDFPVAIDKPSGDSEFPIPHTMNVYQMKGTPTLILIDREGNIRKHKMGQEQDMVLGAEIMALLNESSET